MGTRLHPTGVLVLRMDAEVRHGSFPQLPGPALGIDAQAFAPVPRLGWRERLGQGWKKTWE
jgi:hypothetical protein